MMNAGRLDSRVTVLRATTAPNAFNEPVESWAALATLWAEARPVSDGERRQAGQTLAQQAYRFTVRWSATAASVSPRDRVQHDGRIYDIQGVKDVGRNAFREITAVARVE